MKKKILIDARHPEEKRVAIVEGQLLVDFYVEAASKEHLKGNIYKGVIKRIEPNLRAVFVDFGPKRQGFLKMNEIVPEYLKPAAKGKKQRMEERLSKGQELIVQVEKEERDTKGASLTTRISIPGRYLVMMPGSDMGIKISRKITEKEDRASLKEIVGTLKLPKNTGFIIRTAGSDKTGTDIGNDLKYLVKLWSKIQAESKKAQAPSLVYKEQDMAVRTVRDYLTSEINEVLVDDPEAFRNIKAFLRRTMPWRKINVTHYKADKPVFDRYDLEKQIAKLNENYVYLPSKGYLVIDKTEALTAIDVNSGRSKKDKGAKALILNTNLEAAHEIARQLRLRDIGGLIVIDFIDMDSPKHRREVEEKLKTEMGFDRAQFEMTRISKFGMLELTRERMRAAYLESTYRRCPACEGAGVVKADEMAAIAAFRDIHMQALKREHESATCRLPVESANYLANIKRAELAEIEKQTGVKINIIADPSVLSGQYALEMEGLKEEAPREKEAVKQEGGEPEGKKKTGRKKSGRKKAAVKQEGEEKEGQKKTARKRRPRKRPGRKKAGTEKTD
jgi:ribonuclease E